MRVLRNTALALFLLTPLPVIAQSIENYASKYIASHSLLKNTRAAATTTLAGVWQGGLTLKSDQCLLPNTAQSFNTLLEVRISKKGKVNVLPLGRTPALTGKSKNKKSLLAIITRPVNASIIQKDTVSMLLSKTGKSAKTTLSMQLIHVASGQNCKVTYVGTLGR